MTAPPGLSGRTRGPPEGGSRQGRRRGSSATVASRPVRHHLAPGRLSGQCTSWTRSATPDGCGPWERVLGTGGTGCGHAPLAFTLKVPGRGSHTAIIPIGCALTDDVRRCEACLLRLVRVARVHLLQEDRALVDVEPDARGALRGRFVLPPLMGRAATLDDAELTLEPIVRRRRGQWRPREEVPGSPSWGCGSSRRGRANPSARRLWRSGSRTRSSSEGEEPARPSWRPPRLRTLHGLIVVEPLQTGAAAAEPGRDGGGRLLPGGRTSRRPGPRG